ncbi:hypothetical protein SESBI_46336 [Sesbania bispinosa]|nr:hypothetical protein SESBI_46336 [Sesbania bispinosa]
MGNLFEENVKLYPCLTRAFYAVATIEKRGDKILNIRNWLRGKEILIESELVCKLTGMKAQGIYLYNERDWMDIADVSKEEVGKVLFITEKMSSEPHGALFNHNPSITPSLPHASNQGGKAPPLPQFILPTPSSSPIHPSPILPSSPGEQGAS